MQQGLFNAEDNKVTPLAHQVRPENRQDYEGFDALARRFPFLRSDTIPSLIIWGPPGSGKTTLAKVLGNEIHANFYEFSAVLSGVADLKKLIQKAQEEARDFQRKSIIFIDEIHRFNKAQQDALLPHVEQGSFILIGATTENPRRSVNRALLSRMKIIELKSFTTDKIRSLIKRTISKLEKELSQEYLELICDYANGDARIALGSLEVIFSLLEQEDEIDFETVKNIIKENSRNFDAGGDRHYDVISAFIKSMRGSDPNSAILWLAVMLDGGEDPVFIARRLVIFASEDVGNADLNALTVATNALHVVQNIGMPEARITLAQATTYLASTVKSNAAYNAINEALAYVENSQTIEVPEHLKNFPDKFHKVKYQYPHSFEGSFVRQQYAPNGTPKFYQPKDIGVEKNIKKRLSELWGY
ncbi:MgsA AAA+ ATPase family protein [Bacteriovorax sp. BAL6_X]|uniref:replication-associated recombination protein A n=1 Tax=Bacteriovorax sp. BAL6_X TaxID=1201290 RepID=UPI0003862090|nr:replication-associated recombination protein A [Bacteriovorax sp. BAL6_X]EPZ52145.1 MgsA AAA+ ATPase family protein [Bacteriovorax sp. BAL6_X]